MFINYIYYILIINLFEVITISDNTDNIILYLTLSTLKS